MPELNTMARKIKVRSWPERSASVKSRHYISLFKSLQRKKIYMNSNSRDPRLKKGPFLQRPAVDSGEENILEAFLVFDSKGNANGR